MSARARFARAKLSRSFSLAPCALIFLFFYFTIKFTWLLPLALWVVSVSGQGSSSESLADAGLHRPSALELPGALPALQPVAAARAGPGPQGLLRVVRGGRL